MIIDRLIARVTEFGPVCVGLDTSTAIVPDVMISKWGAAEAVLRFNREIIAATADIVACFKVQIAHYEALGVEGMACYRDTLAEIRRNGVPVIGDVKRGDIASTAAMYAKAHFSGDFEVDWITVNPYMGLDAITPYLDDVEKREKGLFVLVRTSNPSSSELQDLTLAPDGSTDTEDRRVYETMADCVTRWGEPFRGGSGYSSIGAVVGATHPQQLARIREQHPRLFFLVPGYGAQGGGGRDVAPAFLDGNGAVVNASRSILGAYRAAAGPEEAERRFAECARKACLAMREDIRQWMT